MPYVSEKLIERTWKRMGAFEGAKIQKLQKRHQKSQKALTMFVYSFLEDFDEDACGVLLYVFHVVLEAFCNANPRPKRVSKPQIETAIEEKEAQAYSSMTMTMKHSPEPFVLKYVFEALTDERDVVLTKDEIASFFFFLLIVTECLHRACSRTR